MAVPTQYAADPDRKDDPELGSSPRGGRGGSEIEYRNVSKQYDGSGGPAAVADISLRINRGELVVLLGPSGCGKTTLLKLTNRLFEPTSGTITIDGEDTRSLAPAELRRHMGYVIQQTGLFPHLRIDANIAVVPRLLGWKRDRIRQRVTELLEIVGLDPDTFRRRFPSQLSGGQQQRVGLARALAGEPGTLLMDEPFGALDAITRTRLQDEVRRIHRQMSQTIIFVTHDIEEALRLADRIVIMRDGGVVQYDTPLKIITEPTNDFVAELVGSEDVMRRLELQPITDAIRPLDGSFHPGKNALSVPEGTFAREALSQLLASDTDALTVVDADGHPVGQLDFAAIHELSQPSDAVEHVAATEADTAGVAR